jgi:hypothetical protein
LHQPPPIAAGELASALLVERVGVLLVQLAGVLLVQLELGNRKLARREPGTAAIRALRCYPD